MAQSRVKLLRWIAAPLLAAGVALLGFLFRESFVASSYDSLHSLAALEQKSFADPRVVIVYLDLASFLHEHQDPGNRWPRQLHAQLLQRLTAEGARAVVFDILFDSRSENESADLAFAQALKENSHAILAAEHNSKSTHDSSAEVERTRATKLLLPNKMFANAAAGWGVASLWVDDDVVVRRHLSGFGPGRAESLSWAAARQLQLAATHQAADAQSGNVWVRYYGPALTVPHVSYSEALDPAALPPDYFRDKIVFIGARPIEGFMDARRDEFRSPFHAWSNKEYFMPGVEVHATQLLNLLRGDALQRLSAPGENLLLLAVALLFGAGLLWLRPIPATLVAVVGASAALGLALAGFSGGVWFPWLVVSAVQIPAALFGAWLWQFQEWFFTRRKLEAAKRIADAKIREQAALLDKAHDAILVQSLDGKILYANPSAGKLFGWSTPVPGAAMLPDGNAPGKNQATSGSSTAAPGDGRAPDWLELFSADAAAAAKARAAALQDGEWNGELKLLTRAGGLVIAASRWTLIRDDANQPNALLLISSDITEQKNLEQQFLRTQRMNTIGTLAGGMAHDLNNALAPVLLGAQLLRRKATDEEDKKLLTLIETSTNRGADMVRQVLLFARGRGGEAERLELGALIKELEKIVRETFPKNITVETFIPSDLWPVLGNLTQVHQILLNLCVNARDAMPDGGKLSFVADNVELTAEEVKQMQGGNIPHSTPLDSSDPAPPSALGVECSRLNVSSSKFVSVSVSDTGTGMPPEVRARIFEPFFTTKGEGKGTGIGLATVVRIVKSHGGFLRVESEVGQGTSFEVFLPCASETPAGAVAATVEELPRGHGELILVADDERALGELVASELREYGYRVLTAANGAEAVTLFRQHAEDFRLLITDNSMPVMNGARAIIEIRQLRADLPVIIASGEDGNDAPANTVALNKPFALTELLNAVSRSLK